MKFFNKQELVGVSIILSVIVLISLYNFQISIRRARDAQRKDDIRDIAYALEQYNADTGVFPMATEDGKIIACKGPDTQITDKGVINMASCGWGEDSLADISDESYPPYLKTLPPDPSSSKGYSYTYISNGKRFQVLASLEGKDEDEYDEKIEARGIHCGLFICNFGRAYGRTPLDKSLEEYENELIKIQN